MAVVTCDAISRGQCGLVSAIRHDTSHTVHLHPGHCSNTNTSDWLVLSLLTLLPVSARILCFKEHLTPGKWPVWTCVPFRRFYLDGALLHITGFHDDHHLNPNLNCLWELRCGGHYNRAPSLQGYYHNSDCVCSPQWRFCTILQLKMKWRWW